MKQRNRNSQRQGESQRPTPEAMAPSLCNRDYGTAGSFHRKPLVSDGISRLGDVFKAAKLASRVIVNEVIAFRK
jgi:hypothetical protein